VTYSVCTMHRPENGEVVEALGAEIEDLGSEFPDFRHPRDPRFLLTLPHIHGTAGFFVARMRK
jgi:16S rRNA (cytosine967-C5)-methyltransferase